MNKPLFSMGKNAVKQLEANGWVKSEVGHSETIEFKRNYELYIRKRPISDVIITSNSFRKSNIRNISEPEKPLISKVKRAGAKETNGTLKSSLPPVDGLPDFSRYPSLKAVQNGSPTLVIGFDSEWFGASPRNILSWQFALVLDGLVYEFIFINRFYKGYSPASNISLEFAIGRIIDELDSKNEIVPKAIKASTITVDGKRKYDKVKHYSVTLVCHASIVDLTNFNQSSIYNIDFMERLTSAGGGMFNMFPIKLHPHSFTRKSGNKYIYPISINFRDSMCSAPAKACSLEDLGETIGVPKIEVNVSRKEHMNDFLLAEPVRYFEYASRDAIIAMLYTQAIYGQNLTQSPTILTAAAKNMKLSIKKYLGCKNDDEYNERYRGLIYVTHGLVERKPRGDRPGYLESSESLEPINDRANTVQNYASFSYHGGYNSCSEVGYFPCVTFDYDLQNAYPTAMCLVPDVDWGNCILDRMENRLLCKSDFINDDKCNCFPIMFCYVKFEFPESVKYPCIPICDDGVPFYPRTSDGVEGVYACGPELYLAVMLGAKVYVETGYKIRTRLNCDKTESYSLRTAVKQLVSDRTRAKKDYGKGTLAELILKLMVNGSYGKTAQDVVKKYAWSVYRNEMEDIGASCVTNPVSASQITSIVRAVLLATQNELSNCGYSTCSVTTDGFISDAPFEVLKSCNLYGMRAKMESARLFLTDGNCADMWEIKHAQDDLLNFCTRGNISRYAVKDKPMILYDKKYDGVCAHNGVKSKYESGSLDDRNWLYEVVASRNSKISYECKEWTNLKDVVHTYKENPNTPVDAFEVIKRTKNISMDYDLKRCPDYTTLKPDNIVIGVNTFEVAHFDTRPFENIEEFRKYRRKRKNVAVLRTVNDWLLFKAKIASDEVNTKIKDLEWSKLTSCIRYYRVGIIDIPTLSFHKDDWSVQDICDWIQSHNHSSKLFKQCNWKDCRKPDRLSSALPISEIKDLMNELQSDIP